MYLSLALGERVAAGRVRGQLLREEPDPWPSEVARYGIQRSSFLGILLVLLLLLDF